MNGPRTGGQSIHAFRLFFPLAALFAAAAIPLWALQYLGVLPLPSAAAPWHGHEMVFGFALAVVGGYLLTKVPRTVALAAVAAWAVGRVVPLAGSALSPLVGAAVLLAYPVLLFIFAGLPFHRAAKSPRNLVFAPLIGGFILAEVLFQAGRLGILADGMRQGLVLGLDLLTLLLFVMGGRVIAAATSGAVRRRGGLLPAVAQARLEWIGLWAILAMILANLTERLPAVAAGAALIAAGTIALRLVGWRAWRVWDMPEVSMLHLGYVWLAVGLVLEATSALLGVPIWRDALHGVGIGALGTLTAVMMARTALQRSRRRVDFPGAVMLAVVLITVAALLRLLAAIPDLRLPLIGAAAAFWTIAFAILAVFYLRSAMAPAPRRGAGS